MSRNKKSRSNAKGGSSKKRGSLTQSNPAAEKKADLEEVKLKSSETEPENEAAVKSKNDTAQSKADNNEKSAYSAPEKAVQPKETDVKKKPDKLEQKAAKPLVDNGVKVKGAFSKIPGLMHRVKDKKCCSPKTDSKKRVSFDYDSMIRRPWKKFLHKTKEHVLSANPVFVKAIAIVPILGAAVSLKNGLALSAAMFVTVVILNLIMYPLYRHIPHGFRFAAALAISGVIITPVYILAKYFVPNITSIYGIYLPIIAVCALPMIEKGYYGKRHGAVKTAVTAALDGIGFAFAALIVSIIREIIGSGTLYGRPMPYFSEMKFSYALLPAGAFLLLGMLIALFRKIFGKSESDISSKG